MTIREAYSIAGYPIPPGAIVIFDDSEFGFLYGKTEWLSTGYYAQPYYRLTARTEPYGIMYSWVQHGMRDPNLRRHKVNLGGLPAYDAYDVLPTVVQRVLKP